MGVEAREKQYAQAIFLGYTSYARGLRADGQRETTEQARRRVAARARDMIADVTRRGTLPLLLSPSFPGVAPLQALCPDDAARILRGTRGGGVAFHHLVLSPHPRILLSERPPYEVYTRAALDTLRRRKCYPSLVWMAVHHTDTVTHPHVHVVLLGYQPRRYGERPLALVPDDARMMGETVAAYCRPTPVELRTPRRAVVSLVQDATERRDDGRTWLRGDSSDTDGDGP